MTYSKGLNASAATLTKNRTPESVCPTSGLCTTCVEGCLGLCEVGKSAYRGREVIYPQPFGTTTSASQKEYPIDYSHFNIMGTSAGAEGIEPDSDKAIFPAVNTETEIGRSQKIKMKLPVTIPGLGSTTVAKNNWKGLAVGAAISGVILTVGENVCGMDPYAEFKNGKVTHSPDLVFRVRTFRDWYNGYGTIAIQANVEDSNLGVLEYAIEKLGVEAVELKWGQGAKNIGGEIKIDNLEKALQYKKRGYVVLPDPEDLNVKEAFKAGSFSEFERHSRIGMVTEDSFKSRVRKLRQLGAKYIFLKTGAYRPLDLAKALKWASDCRLDLVTVDGAGGGTGMSPWRMMNEWGIPTVYLESLVVSYLKKLESQKAFIPDIVIAGGFSLEDQIFKALALGAPYVKAVGMSRAPLTAVMVGKTIGNLCDQGKVPNNLSAKYGNTKEQIFSCTYKLRQEYGKDLALIPSSAIGLYSYFDRLKTGLQQLMCGARKFALSYISRNDLAALTREASEISGVPYITDIDKEQVEMVLVNKKMSQTM